MAVIVNKRHKATLSVLLLLLRLIFVVHLLACTWFFLGLVGKSQGNSAWIDSLNYFSSNDSNSTSHLYAVSFLGVFRGLLGHQSALNDCECLFLSILLMFGLFMLGFIVSSLHFIQSELKEVQKEFAQKMTAVNRYMISHNVAVQQRRRATKYLEGQYLQGLDNRLSTD